MITGLIVLIALGVLVWGFYRARPFGKAGIFAWLQSVLLIVPWLLFFGLFATGIYLNLAIILFVFVICTSLYIFLGSRLRAIAQETLSQNAATIDRPDVETTTEKDPKQVPSETLLKSEDGSKPVAMPIPAEDLKTIQGIFSIDTFFSTETIPYQDGAIFKGNLRGEVEAVYAKLAEKLQTRIGDRYRLFLLENQEGRPVVIVLPSTNDPKPTTTLQWLFAGGLLLATIATSLETAGLLRGFDLSANMNRISEVLPISAGFLGILLIHELGHYLLARRHHIRLSPPFFIPTWQIGAFGALTRFESLLPDRRVLFDIAFAGPIAGGVISLILLLLGLSLSQETDAIVIPSQFFQGSILVAALSKFVLGDRLQSSLVHIHPLVLLGWLGLVINAINLMPAGQLDGGRIAQAIYGRKVAGRLTVGTLIVLGLATFANPLALYWAAVILFLQRTLERPSLNELVEVDDTRATLGLMALFAMVIILLPLTSSLAIRLGIGG